MGTSTHLRFLLLLIFSLWVSQTQAAHIIGGEFSYECLGGGDYRFTLRLYRDCAGGGAQFDGGPGAPFVATVSIYEGNSNVPINIELGPPSIMDVDPEISNPCLVIPPGICVEEGVYIFTRNLPLSSESYHITYQRCCRNNSITNLVDPGGSGATYTIELTPEAQSLCNNSPSFNKIPPIIICAGEDINYDFSASDVDGDSLEYYLCTPFLGGGTNQTQFTLPNGVAPNPDMPPPYNPVFFVAPYSFLNPLGGNPPLSIDPSTGLISGVPDQLGQFVVGVCVEEYRNGQLLSVSRRDFQFNVADCEPTVVADIEEDEIINGQDFVVISCGDETVSFVNESYQLQYINSYEWVFDIDGVMESFFDWDPTVTFPGVGTYEGKLMINPGTTCADTANIFVNIFPEIVSDFSFEYDTCDAGIVNFTDLSYTGAGPNAITDWAWNFDDGNLAFVQDPDHLYQIPGTFSVRLTVTDINTCRDANTYELPYYPVPDLIVIAPSEFVGCEPASITFNNLSFPIDTTYDVVWDFGDGKKGSGLSPTHEYTEPGVFTVSLDITSPIGCTTDTTFFDLIEILPSPDAGFTYSPNNPSNIEPTVQFIDQSKEAQSWRWDFAGISFSLLPSPVFTFPDTGLQVVTQIVTHASGCKDTAVQIIDIFPEVRYFLPNAFTPNGDGINDLYRGEGVMEGARQFQFQVWNRYGELIYESSDPFEAWNGRKNNIGVLSPPGVYVVVVNYKTPRGKPVQLKGYAVLIN